MRKALALAALVTALPALELGCSNLTAPPPETIYPEAGAASASATAAATAPARPTPPEQKPADVAGDPETELKIEDQTVGKGPAVRNGDTVLVHYAGTLRNGTKFDASKDHPDKKPLPVTVGSGVIEGFSQGLVGMKVGGKRKVTIPWRLAYGAEGRPPIIPPKSTLIFELELVEIKGAK